MYYIFKDPLDILWKILIFYHFYLERMNREEKPIHTCKFSFSE